MYIKWNGRLGEKREWSATNPGTGSVTPTDMKPLRHQVSWKGCPTGATTK